MAIKGVSEIRRLSRLGKIRLGEKALAQSGKEYPKAVDYFVCPPEVQAVYGEKPQKLIIVFPADDRDEIFPQWYKRYNRSSQLICKGDGETAVCLDPETREMQEIECCPDECEWYAKKHCRRLAHLRFLLHGVPGVGIWQIDTTSFHSIVNINSAIEAIRTVTGGRIRGIPLHLILKPKEVQPDGIKKTVYVMDLFAPYTLQKLATMGQNPAPIFVLPKIDENERPEDLYPDIIFEKDMSERMIPTDLPKQDVVVVIPDEEKPAPTPPVQDTVIVPDEDVPGPVVVPDEGEAQPAAPAFNDDEAAFPPVDEENPFVGAGDAGNTGDEIPWWEVPPDQMENAFGDFPGEVGPVPEPPAELPKEQKQKEQKKEEKKAEGEWKVRLTEKPPVKPVKVNGAPSWVLAVERNTKQGLIKGTLLVPAGLIKEEFIKSLIPKKDILIVTGVIAGGESGFVITAQSVRVEKAAA